MNNTLSKIIIFAAGAAIGSVVTWKLVRDKYEQITREEIQSIRDFYATDEQQEINSEEGLDEPTEEDRSDYDKIIKGSDYVAYASDKLEKQEKTEKKEEEKAMFEPYVIPPEEFDENGYKTVTLYCFADGVITNEMEEVVENVNELIIEDVMDHFGEYEEDSVYVRNDNLETDFEILKDCRRYSEVD